MLSLGDADSILVTDWKDGAATYVLIDGGYAKDAPVVEKFLGERNVDKIDHLVSTHLHDDHICGLVKLVQNGNFEIGRAWIHLPERHVDIPTVNTALGKTAELKESQLVTASVQAEQNLVALLQDLKIDIEEPFEGANIGPLTVYGPSVEYYEQLLAQYREAEKIKKLQETYDKQKIAADVARWLGRAYLLSDPRTQAENLSCTVLGTRPGGDLLLLTADSGAASLEHAKEKWNLSGCRWMQIPHHGSLYNVTQNLVDYFSPKVAYVSAAGNDDHPNAAVVASFKKAGTEVYSTHKSGNLWFHHGDVPSRERHPPTEPL